VNRSETNFDKVLNGDINAIINMLVPSHFGARIQTEIVPFKFVVGVSVSVGVNVVYNRVDGEFFSSGDVSIQPGIGTGSGISATVGPLIGWNSSKIEDSTSGDSYITGVSGAYGVAGSIAISVPKEGSNLLAPFHNDPVFGQVPVTVYVGVGSGAIYGSWGAGVCRTIPIDGQELRVNLYNIFPWFSKKR
jgi:hypothetical protein